MNKQALICEDSITTAYCIKEMLDKFGYESEIATTATEAVKALEQKKYDLLTLDMLLPDVHGKEVLKRIKTIPLAKNLPIIVISATKKEHNNIDFDNNVIYWMQKTFNISALEEIVSKIINNNEKNKVSILHVENDRDLSELISIMLSDIANVTGIKKLSDAEKELETNQYDIIILDYVFPEGTSDKLIPTIKYGVNKKAKIIMFSAYEENRIIARYVDEVIIKTNVSFDEFKLVIEKFIRAKE